MEKIEIKPITYDDYEFGYEIKKRTLREYIEKTYGEWVEEKQVAYYSENFKLENNFTIIFDGAAIGWLECIENDSSIEINQIFILPEYQNQGIGSKVISDIIEKAKNTGKRISLQVLKSNERALGLYTRMGFKKYNETKTHWMLEIKASILIGTISKKCI